METIQLSWKEICRTPYSTLIYRMWDDDQADVNCNCPICEKILTNEGDYLYCQNDCFSMNFWQRKINENDVEYTDMVEVTIFSDFSMVDPSEELDFKRIEKEINYWKENYHYLAEILMRR